MTYRNRQSPMGYREALRWLLDNDDCEWLAENLSVANSVTASLVADIYRRSDEDVRADLLALRDKLARAGAA